MQNFLDILYSYGIGEKEIYYVLLFLSLLFLIFFVKLVLLLKPRYKDYTEDIFYDIKWKWQWKNGKIISLWCYCPNCGSELLCDDENCKNNQNLKEKITYFICQNCGESQKGKVIGGDRNYALKMVEREIVKKVSNKTFQVEQNGV